LLRELAQSKKGWVFPLVATRHDEHSLTLSTPKRNDSERGNEERKQEKKTMHDPDENKKSYGTILHRRRSIFGKHRSLPKNRCYAWNRVPGPAVGGNDPILVPGPAVGGNDSILVSTGCCLLFR